MKNYWNKNKEKLEVTDRSYNSFEMGVKFANEEIAKLKHKIQDLEKENKRLRERLEFSDFR